MYLPGTLANMPGMPVNEEVEIEREKVEIERERERVYLPYQRNNK